MAISQRFGLELGEWRKSAHELSRAVRIYPAQAYGSYMTKTKLTPEAVAAIREAWDSGRIRSLDALGAKYRVSLTTVAAIVNRKSWKSVAEPELTLRPGIVKASRMAFI